MPQKKFNKKKTFKKGSKKSYPDESIIAYHGPIMLKGIANSVKPVKVNGTYYAAATTSGGGVIDVVFGSSPAVLNDWSSYTGLYHEFRVLGMELKFVPVKNVANWAYGFGVSVVDRDNSSALGSITAGTNHESCQIHQMYGNWKRRATMNGADEASWQDVSSPSSKYYVKLYSSGNAAIQTIGGFFLTYLIEFRTKS